MIRIEGQPILTAAGMRAAEDASGVATDALMARAGAAIAEAVRRLAGANDVLILCGPGNNGGDGYVAAAVLKAGGHAVRVAVWGAPKTEAAKRARPRWDGPVEALADAGPAAVLVDALFGTGLSRALIPNSDTSPAEAGLQSGDGADLPKSHANWAPAFAGEVQMVQDFHRLAAAASLRIAIDLPSGVATDDGSVPTPPPVFEITLALGAVKPAHVLQPAARYCGAVRVLDIGVAARSDVAVLAHPLLPAPGPDSHKYSRGMVAVVAGDMAGASELASLAAMHAGAGYVLLLGEASGPPHALVRKAFADDALDDPRIGAVVIGPGLGRDDDARSKLAAALRSGRPLVIDGDALRLLDLADAHGAILTPHGGEFDHLFGAGEGGKIVRARAAAVRADAVVVFKGADTVVAAPDGRVAVATEASDWLSTAGTGDVLAGAIGAMRAGGLDAFDAACAGVWLHAAAGRAAGPAFIADDLAILLSKVRAPS